LNFGYWDLFVICDLEFGIFRHSITPGILGFEKPLKYEALFGVKYAFLFTV